MTTQKKQYTLRKDGAPIGAFSTKTAAIDASGQSIFTKPTPDGCSKAWNVGDVWSAFADDSITITVSRAITAATMNELAVAAHRINTDSEARKQMLALIPAKTGA